MTNYLRFTLVLLAALGCGRSRSESTTTASEMAVPTTGSSDQPSSPPPGGVSMSPIVPVSGASASSSGPSSCPRTGKWALCSIEKRLEQSGFVVKPAGDAVPRRAGFSVAPTVYSLGKSHLEVFLYPDKAAAARDVEQLDTLQAAPRGSVGAWPTPPTFVRSANAIAVFLTESAQQAERLALALTAGPPQP
jgi:hypothetical protein